MDISGEYMFDVPRHVVWNALQNPSILQVVLPGGQGFETIDENQFSGMLEVKVGPVQGKFQGKIKLSDFKAPESYWMDVDGQGAAGVVKASGRLHLEARGSQTHLQYVGMAHVSGRIASVGQRLIETAARSIIRQSLDRLHEYLKANMEQAPELETEAEKVTIASTDVAARALEPPSSAISGTRVVRDVFNDIIPAKYQIWLMAAGFVVVLFIIFLLASR